MLQLTRHAKNNMRLYQFTTDDIKFVIENAENQELQDDKIVASAKVKNKFQNMPLKVVYITKENTYTIITAYPLKKRYTKRGAKWK